MEVRNQIAEPARSPRPVTPLGLLAAKLAELERRAELMPELDDAFRSELREVHALAGGLDPYVRRCTTAESAALAELDRRTMAEDWEARSDAGGTPGLEREMLSGHVEGQFLKLLVHVTGVSRVLEVGMFTGYSALAMAEALPEDGELVACEVDAYAAQFAAKCFAESSAGGRISIRLAPALSTMKGLAAAGDSFGLIFIDADKPSYVDYYSAVLDLGLLEPGGLICVDNTLMQGQPYLEGEPTENGTAIRAFNRLVAGDPRVEQVLLPLRDGLTLIRTVQ